VATNSELEAEVQKQWRLRAEYRNRPVHNRLLHNEFTESTAQKLQTDRLLQVLMEHCYDTVPYYQDKFLECGIRRRHLRDAGVLSNLPILERREIIAAQDLLHARQPMRGQSFGGYTRTSGSTGEPVTVRHSNLSLGFFPWLKQRELRWFRWQPHGSLLSIRPAAELSPEDQGKSIPKGVVQQLQTWPLLGDKFETGPSWGFSHANPVTAQADLLGSLHPNYLLMQAAGIEHLSLQVIDAAALDQLHGALAISQTLTPAMRKLAENALQVPVQQNYGLNEIGLVASRCPEAGRYHVHSEHCLVEIVDDDGRQCAPGETGRLLVTGLNNSLMPLLRYDADDLAEVAGGPCPCGRKLPSFADIIGRYRRIAYLPEGTFPRWGAIQRFLVEYSLANPGSIRQYQVIQDREANFLLRIDCAPEVLSLLKPELQNAFEEAAEGSDCPALRVEASRDFVGVDQRKFQSFISAFTPESDQ